MTRVNAGETRFAHIDSMRAMAVLVVVWSHVAQTFADVAGSGLWLGTFAQFSQPGWAGVTLFFLVSGFVIPSSLKEGAPRLQELQVFGIRRFFRLYPAYWLSIVLAVPAAWWLLGKPIDWDTILANLTMLQTALGVESVQGLYWTLLLELVFYVLCALLFAFGLLHRANVLLAVSGLCTGVFLLGYIDEIKSQPLLFRLFFQGDFAGHLGLMFAGAVLRRWHDGRLDARWIKLGLVALLMLWVSLPLWRGLSTIDGQLVWRYPPSEATKAIAIAVLVVLGLWLKLRNPILSWLGGASYAIYLFHQVVYDPVHWLVQRSGAELLRGYDLGIYLAVCLALTLLLAAAVHHWLELPMIALGRKLKPLPAATAPVLATGFAPASKPLHEH